jgi:hypothetical protein
MKSLKAKMEQTRRELLRGSILLIIHSADTYGATENLIGKMVQNTDKQPYTADEVRKELAYLKLRELLHISNEAQENWHVTLTRIGVDVVEGSIPLENGIVLPVER